MQKIGLLSAKAVASPGMPLQKLITVSYRFRSDPKTDMPNANYDNTCDNQDSGFRPPMNFTRIW